MIFVAFSIDQKAAPTQDHSDVPGTAADGRATEFQAASNEVEHYSGEKLLVAAYALIWLIMMVWLGLMWLKQRSINTRVEGLERAIDRAEKRLADDARRQEKDPGF